MNFNKKRFSFKNLIKAFIPWKNDSAKEIIRKAISLIALVAFIGSATYLGNYYLQGNKNVNLVSSARDIYNPSDDGVRGDGMLVRFEELYNQNPDIMGWIKIDGTTIDYPVYQSLDNDFYVNHDMSKQKSRYGAIFVDNVCKITPNGTSDNLTIYGHNMIDRSMFTELLEYKKLNYYKSHPLINFDTIYAKGVYKVFAVIVTNANKSEDDGFVFNYRQNSFSSEMGFLTFIENLKVRSIINTNVDVEYGDKLITLSTCSYEFKDARTVVFARRIRSGEAGFIDTSKAKVNKTPLYPQAYYDKHGGKKPKVKINVQTKEQQQEQVPSIEGGEVISQNQGYVVVENLTGATLEAAIAQVNNLGLSIDKIEYDGSSEKFNKVKKQSVKAGKRVPKGTKITLYVTGKATKITMPDFVGKKLKKANKIANKKGISLNVMQLSSNLEKDLVISQSIKAGTVVDSRSVVIYVSSGKNSVPKVTGKTKERAENLLLKAGFKVKVEEVVTKDAKKLGKVLKQTPKAKAYKEVGKKVTIYVGVKKKSANKTSSKSETTSATSSTTSKPTNTVSSATESTADTTTESSNTTSSEDITSSGE